MASTSVRQEGRYRKGERVLYQQNRGSSTRVAYVSKCQAGGYELRVFEGGCVRLVQNVSETDARSVLRMPEDIEMARHYAADFERLDRYERGDDVTPEDCAYESLAAALQQEKYSPKAAPPGKLRFATHNVCHLGSNDVDEKIRNISAVIELAQVDVVVFQEVSPTIGGSGAVKKVAEQCGMSSCVSKVTNGECYALLWKRDRTAAALGCASSKLRCDSFLYEGKDTGDASFRRDVRWGVTTQRQDFSFEGASGARLPAFFRLRGPGGSGIVVATLHSACKDAELRKRQFRAVGSLLPEKTDDKWIYVLAGDFNSSYEAKGGVSFTQMPGGETFEKNLADRGFCLASNQAEPTSATGKHYDEIIVSKNALRHSTTAHTFPQYKRLLALGLGDKNVFVKFTPPHIRSSSALSDFKTYVFSDHLLLYVDIVHSDAPLTAESLSEVDEYSTMTKDQLQAELRRRNMKVSGNKKELIERLQAADDSSSPDTAQNDVGEYSTMTVEQLKAELRRRNMKVSGLKQELIERLQAADDSSSPDTAESDVGEYSTMTVEQLKAELRRRNMKVSGLKKELIERLLDADKSE